MKHAQSWGVFSGMKRVGGRGYTKLDNSHKSTEQGLNFPLCCSIFFIDDLKITTKMKSQQSCEVPQNDNNRVGFKLENHHMTNPLGLYRPEYYN